MLQADIGTRICYTQYGSFDTHTNELALQGKLWTDVAGGIYDLYADLKAYNASDDVLIFVFSEFGRRVKDNGNGTNHGSGGVSFLIGDHVEGATTVNIRGLLQISSWKTIWLLTWIFVRFTRRF